MKKSNLLHFLLIIIVLSACKSKQQLLKPVEVEKKPVELLIEKIIQNEPKFNTSNVSKMNLMVALNDRTFSVSASCKLIPDSAIHISIQPALGIELFKMEMNKDSFFIFDKVNKRFYAAPYRFFETRFGVQLDFAGMEALISNRFFIAGQKSIAISNLSVHQEGEYQTVNYAGSKINQATRANINYRIEKVNLAVPDSKYRVDADYSSFVELDSISFPQKISIKATDSRNKLNCDFNINRVTFNDKIVLQYADKKRFTQANIEQLLKK